MSRSSRRKQKPHLNGNDRIADHPDTRVQQLTAELGTMRSQLTDLRLREAVARRQAEALQAEVERLNALLGGGLFGRLFRFWRPGARRAYGYAAAASE